ncbi:membrane protein [Salmonella enterica subsp. enterica]|uniref:Membrane protein n=1 Tax=Salmonella enterica I TaxID=59201 RepID=A0A379VTZ8_SALET|nr:membrane protein [Salmonella enterica subsp. enterica]
MSLAFLRALRRDRFFQLLIIVGMALSLFVPFAPAPGLARLTGTPLLPSVG